MNLARGPRPWSVQASVALLLACASVRLAQRLSSAADYGAVWQGWIALGIPAWDMGVIGACTLVTIACIPPALLWFRASRMARALIGVMAAGWLLLPSGPIIGWATMLPVDLALSILPLLAFAFLLTPSAHRWLGSQRMDADKAVA